MAFVTFSFIKCLIVFLMRFVCFSNGCRESTFHNTSVIVGSVKSVKSIDGCFQPTPILMKASYIQVVNQSIPIIQKDAITRLPHLVDIILEDDNISQIIPGAFYDLPSLYLIKIKHNKLTHISEGVFNHLQLTELSLTSNNIERIHKNAFNDMPNLSILFLNENRITSWNSDWFVGSPKISVLNFEYNLISHIPARAVQNVKGYHYVEDVKLNVSTNIQLNNNIIRYLEDGAFDGIESLGWLFLHKNELEEITVRSLGSLNSVEWIRLESNKLACIPQKLINISPRVVYYLSNNPLSTHCRHTYQELN